MKIALASDHAGFALKQALAEYLAGELSHEVVDCGAFSLDRDDDYNEFVAAAADQVATGTVERAIVIGGSGQGEAMQANRTSGVRAMVYYGEPALPQIDQTGTALGMVASGRIHNDANVISLGARFIDVDEAKRAVKEWLNTPFSEAPRHARRISKLES